MRLIVTAFALFLSLAASGEETAPAMTMGNGDSNWIVSEGATRSDTGLVFPKVHIDGNGWLVLHPFVDGKPDGNVVAGSSYINSGTNENVAIQVSANSGDRFIVMLHSDVDEDAEFDFVFVGDTGHVEDRAVFEGNKMIGHVFVTP